MSYLEPILVHPVRREIFCDTSAQIFFTILKLRHTKNYLDDHDEQHIHDTNYRDDHDEKYLLRMKNI